MKTCWAWSLRLHFIGKSSYCVVTSLHNSRAFPSPTLVNFLFGGYCNRQHTQASSMHHKRIYRTQSPATQNDFGCHPVPVRARDFHCLLIADEAMSKMLASPTLLGMIHQRTLALSLSHTHTALYKAAWKTWSVTAISIETHL